MSQTRTLHLFLATILPFLSFGQQINITSGSAESCSGVIEDSGGPNAPYANNEDITFTICPDVPGNVIYLTWFVFNLSTEGPGADNLTIYDGDNTGATTLGTYSGSALQNIVVSGTVFNTTGCLTLVFHSNGTGTGEFAAGFQCTVPCQHPIAEATMPGAIPALICQGETLDFDGSGSFAQAGQVIDQYLWDFDDGTVDSTSGPFVSHTFVEDGEHVVQLYITDDNDCTSLNLVDLQILVSTTPDFGQTTPSTEVCFGESVELYGHADPVTWTGIPDANFGEGIFLPDDVGLPFTSTLNFEQFDFGQTITDIGDIESICVEMEHTFMGDLVLQVICPNGQSVILHQQGGGGTYLGAPNDLDSNEDPIFGECWEYCWSPTAGNGTWIDNLANTTVAGTPPNGSLNPGTYESVQPMSNLVGCPLNGEWTYQSTDLWAQDNGFICSWSINFDPSIVPEVTQFTPVIGTEADSSLWTGGTVPDAISTNGDTILYVPTAPGDYPFVYQVTDNFGCTYDTTITVTVNEPFEVDAGPDGVICDTPLQLGATVTGYSSTCAWTLQMDDSWGDGWNGASLTVTIDGVSDTFTCTGDQTIVSLPVEAGVTIELDYLPGTFDEEVSFILFDDEVNIVFQDGPDPAIGQSYSGVTTCGGGNGMTWQWSPSSGLSDPMVADPTVIVTGPTTFFVTAHITGHPDCNATDSTSISIDPALDPGSDSTVVLCATPPGFQLIDLLGGTPEAGGTWTDANGNTVPDVFDPTTDPGGTYTYALTTPTGCVGSAQLEIEILSAGDPSCCGTVDAGVDSTTCTLQYALNAIPGNTGAGQWYGPPGYVFSDASDPGATVTAPVGGTAMFHWIEDDAALCYLIDSVTILFTEPLQANFSLTDAVCFEACDGTAEVIMTGGNGTLQYTWSEMIAQDTTAAVDLCAGGHSVTVVDTNGCTITADFTIAQPDELTIDEVTYTEPLCHGACDGTIHILDPEAVEYSFDGGASFQTAPALASVCAGDHDLVIRSSEGCLGMGMVTVSEPPAVIAAFEHAPIPANVNDPRIFFQNTSVNAVSYAWDIAGLHTTSEADPVFLFSEREPDTYTVCLVAADRHDCTDTVCHEVIIDDVLFTYVPNAFTPDGDGVNDQWGLHHNIGDIKDLQLEVFDRWGRVVFETTDPNVRWNGGFRNGGEVLMQGVYPYRLRFVTASTGGTRLLEGHVTLLR